MNAEFWMKAAAGATLFVNSVTDLRRREILPVFTAVSFSAGLLIRTAAAQRPPGLLLSLLPGIFLMLVTELTGGRIGRGDGLVVLSAGSWLPYGEVFAMVCAAFLLAGAAGVLLIAIRSRVREIPFVPFLLAAFLLA